MAAFAIVCIQVIEEECPLAASLLHHTAAPQGADDCEATAAAAAGFPGHVSNCHNGNSCHSTAGGSKLQQIWELVHEVLLPVAILLIGVGFSVAALYVALLPLLQQPVSNDLPSRTHLLLG
jgi:hypothetical protein